MITMDSEANAPPAPPAHAADALAVLETQLAKLSPLDPQSHSHAVAVAQVASQLELCDPRLVAALLLRLARSVHVLASSSSPAADGDRDQQLPSKAVVRQSLMLFTDHHSQAQPSPTVARPQIVVAPRTSSIDQIPSSPTSPPDSDPSRLPPRHLPESSAQFQKHPHQHHHQHHSRPSVENFIASATNGSSPSAGLPSPIIPPRFVSQQAKSASNTPTTATASSSFNATFARDNSSNPAAYDDGQLLQQPGSPILKQSSDDKDTQLNIRSSSNSLVENAVTGAVSGTGDTSAPASTATTTTTTTTTTGTPTTTDDIVLEGYFLRKVAVSSADGNHSWTWKPRFYRLKEGYLDEFDAKSTQKLKTITLKPTTTITPLDPTSTSTTSAYAFIITDHKHVAAAAAAGGSMSANPGKSAPPSKYTLCTHTQTERDLWVDTVGMLVAKISGGPVHVRRQRRTSASGLSGGVTVGASGGSSSSSSSNSGVNTEGATSPVAKNSGLSFSAGSVEKLGGGVSSPAVVVVPGDKAVGSAGSGGKFNFLQEGMRMFGGGPRRKESPRIVDPDRAIFGAPLARSVEICRLDPSIEICSVVSRCIEFLEAKKALNEEGIYRLSGSTTAIQALKLQFDIEGDLDLLRLSETEMIDVHSVTGLLKLYLRELPDQILGDGDVKREFMQIASLQGKSEKIKELRRLLPMLPLANYALLKTISAHLNTIQSAQSINKMGMSNLGIVFSPTLSVPAGLLQVMVMDHDAVFS